ncbi:acyl-CoA thioesterase [Bacillus sp. FJAT-45350]|uniref:acyl-CoA thioesterase n=1 Tax=Bacillus sp. FJAT-45350 TaxID=2011014 RepID=UPI000BB95F51|nr:thioesterase family protein [Bacillus sp. FJAT-45350]
MSKISYIDNLKEWEQSFSFYCPIKVRFSETDAFGHVNNTNSFVYFEEARIDFFKEMGFMSEWADENSEHIIVTADMQCNYTKQIMFDEKLKAYVKVATIGQSSIDLHYMIKDEKGDICLTGRGLIVQLSKRTGKSSPWNDVMKDKLQEAIVNYQ